MLKVCAKCGIEKDESVFADVPAWRNRKARKHSWCDPCRRQKDGDYRTEYYHNNKQKCDDSAKASTKRLRDAVIDNLGAYCHCPDCGETRRNFLSLEHIDGGGNKHRKSTHRYTLWKQILDAGCPTDKYTVLCYNCNLSRGFLGFCCSPPEVTQSS